MPVHYVEQLLVIGPTKWSNPNVSSCSNLKPPSAKLQDGRSIGGSFA